MSNSNDVDDDQLNAKHALRRNRFGRPLDGRVPVKKLLDRYKNANQSGAS